MGSGRHCTPVQRELIVFWISLTLSYNKFKFKLSFYAFTIFQELECSRNMVDNTIKHTKEQGLSSNWTRTQQPRATTFKEAIEPLHEFRRGHLSTHHLL